jgi:ABC-type multidrug transport system fused ATPase/permease subunit
LARELVARPAVLLLDDTTSALDPETELRVLANLRASTAAGTILMVASRPSTIAAASEVLYVADDGSVHQGTHERLMESLPGYRALLEAFDDDRRGKRVG